MEIIVLILFWVDVLYWKQEFEVNVKSFFSKSLALQNTVKLTALSAHLKCVFYYRFLPFQKTQPLPPSP